MFGQGGSKPGTHDVIIADDLGDGEWHQIDITRTRNRVEIIVDITRKKVSESPRVFKNITVARLHLSIKDNHSNTPRSSPLPQESLSGSAFKGCMEDVSYNKHNIFQAIKEKSKDVQTFGHLSPKCADDGIKIYEPASLSKPTSHIKIATANGQNTNLKFKFRTFDHTGVVAQYAFGSSAKDVLFLELIRGKLLFNNAVISRNYRTYTDGLWHNIQLNITSKGLAFRIDDEVAQTFLNSSKLKTLLQNPMLRIGSSRNDKPSFKGCVKKIELNGVDVDIASNMSRNVDLERCYLTDLCFRNPCLHQGVCMQHNNVVQCDCTNTGYSGSHCQNTSTLPSTKTTSIQNSSTPKSSSISPGVYQSSISPGTTASRLKTSRSVIPYSTVRPSPTTADKLPTTIPSLTKLNTIQTTKSSSLKYRRNPSQGTRKKVPITNPSQFISPTTKQVSTADQLKPRPMTPTRTRILAGKPKRFTTIASMRITTIKPNHPPGSTLTGPTKQSFFSTRKQTLITERTTTLRKPATTSTKKQVSIVEPKKSMAPTRKRILTVKPEQPINNYTTNAPPKPSTTPTTQPTAKNPTHLSPMTPHRPSHGLTQPTNNTQIIIIEKSNTITTIGLNKHQLLVYLFLFIVLLMFVGLIVIISVKMSSINACPCTRQFQTTNDPLPSQDLIELNQQETKDSNTMVSEKNDWPSSLNDSGIDRSESATDSNRSSAEVQEDAISDHGELETSIQNAGDDLVTSPDDAAEGFLILQEDPSLYTQKSFGWTVLGGSGTIRHCRTSTRDLIHAASENKPRAFKSAYYLNSEISEDVRVDVEDDVTRYRNPGNRYRQLATSDSSSLDNMSVDMEECGNTGREGSLGEEYPVV